MLPTRTKVVATLGPALDAPGALEAMIAEGVDVLRVNLSHGPPPTHAARVARARAVKPDIAVLADLCGPKLRLGELPEPVELAEGERVVLGAGGIPVADADFAKRVRAGDPIYLADGAVRLEALSSKGGGVQCKITAGGIVSSRKGINLPSDASELPCLTEKDRSDVSQFDALAPDYVALSYVRHPDDIAALRRLTPRPIIAKIEKQQALERLDAILAAADGLMVARGDLGVEIPIERVPAVQKRLIRAANAAAKPVITATQMLVSMVSSPLPTRAETTDVANAVLDGTDAVMLSEETAVGRDPAGVVRMMEKILRETEPLLPSRMDGAAPVEAGTAIARAAVHLARDIAAVAILVPTMTGASAVRVAAFRPTIPILAFSPRPETVRRLALAWGVQPFGVSSAAADADIVHSTLAEAKKRLPAEAKVVLIAGWPPGVPGNTSFIHASSV